MSSPDTGGTASSPSRFQAQKTTPKATAITAATTTSTVRQVPVAACGRVPAPRELVAAIVSALLGNQWGVTVVYYGLLEGIAPALVFLATRYRRWGLPTALLAGAAAGLAAVVLDVVYYYTDWSASWIGLYAAVVVTSAAVVAGAGGWLLVRALARTGVLAPFASGREQRAV